MVTTNRGGETAMNRAIAEIDDAWKQFQDNLAAYLATMTDPEEDDHLLIELADPNPEGDGPCPPYAQFAGFGDGRMIRAEISGNANLLPQYQLDHDGCDFLVGAGWAGNVIDGDIGERNWTMHRSVDGLDDIVDHVIRAMRYHFGVAHPHLLTYRAWGPAAEGAAVLGLCASDEVPHAEPAVQAAPSPMPLAVEPADRAELLVLVGRVLREKYEGEPTLDEDDDFVLHHMGQPLWIHVYGDQPAVQIMARVAHDVHSRRATAVEIGLLNRDNLWTRWTLRDRAVWQTLVLPGSPFVPTHLDAMLDLFLEALSSTRDDLAYRTGAKVA